LLARVIARAGDGCFCLPAPPGRFEIGCWQVKESRTFLHHVKYDAPNEEKIAVKAPTMDET